ncbi:MAG: hypothetical protein RLZZ419_983 [Pseudomonadota bacterium]
MDARCLNSEAEGEKSDRGLGLEAPCKLNPQPSMTNAILHNTIYASCGGRCFSGPHITHNI